MPRAKVVFPVPKSPDRNTSSFSRSSRPSIAPYASIAASPATASVVTVIEDRHEFGQKVSREQAAAPASRHDSIGGKTMQTDAGPCGVGEIEAARNQSGDDAG